MRNDALRSQLAPPSAFSIMLNFLQSSEAYHRLNTTSHVSVLTFTIFIHIEKTLIVTVSGFCPFFLKDD